ncbi:hypothetical protein CPB86DRAFT_706088 [Serendipita vermifera]|nr:hypothetical protein CPB86DRAFT_706088 [Serendipita vermifera]
MSSASPLQPVDPATIHKDEKEEEKPWIVRKIAQSMAGRIVVAMAQTLQATGTTVVCLSPWGDSVPLILPCIRFRDVALYKIHTVIAATGGAAIIASPMMDSAGTVVVDSFGSSIAVEMGVLAGQHAGAKVANYLLIDKPTSLLIPTHSGKLETTDIKKILITLSFKHILTDAALGYFRAPAQENSEPTLFSNIKDYLSIDKGWFNPYLFASCRRPLIPRSMIPDVVFCHGPWLKGDYSIGLTLMNESTNIVALTPDSELPPEEEDPSLIKKALAALNFGKAEPAQPGLSPEAAAQYKEPSRPHTPTGFERLSSFFGHKKEKSREVMPSPPAETKTDETPEPAKLEKAYPPPSHPPPGHVNSIDTSTSPAPEQSTANTGPPATQNGVTTMIDKLTDQLNQWRGKSTKSASSSEAEAEEAIPTPPPNRRMVVLVLGLSPHRVGVWTSSARPGESVMNYWLLNGCPALVVPIKPGSPLIAWHAVTLKTLQGLKEGVDGQAFKDILDDLVNYVQMCVDEDRITIPDGYAEQNTTETGLELKRKAVRDGMALVLAGAVRSGSSAKVKKDIDSERAGIVFFRIP